MQLRLSRKTSTHPTTPAGQTTNTRTKPTRNHTGTTDPPTNATDPIHHPHSGDSTQICDQLGHRQTTHHYHHSSNIRRTPSHRRDKTTGKSRTSGHPGRLWRRARNGGHPRRLRLHHMTPRADRVSRTSAPLRHARTTRQAQRNVIPMHLAQCVRRGGQCNPEHTNISGRLAVSTVMKSL